MPNFLINVKTRGAKAATSGMKRLSGSLMNLSKVAMVGAAGGALALGVAMKKAADNAGVQEAAEKKLATALGHTNKKLLEQASAFQQQSKFGDEALIEMMALASNMGIAENQIAETTQMAIGLSEALGVDMNMAMKAAAGAIQGDTNMLTRYIPELKTTKDATEKLAIVQTAANKGFEQSKALTDTMTGSMNQAKMAIGDAAESLGMLIEPLIKAGATMSKEFAIKAGEAFKSFEKIDFSKTFENMKTNMGALQGLIVDSFKLAFSMIPDLFRFFMNRIVPLGLAALGKLWEGIKSVSAFLWEPIGIGIQIVIGKVKNFFIGMVNFAKEQFNTLAGIANKLGADIQPMEMSKLIDTEGLSMANSAMVELLTQGSQDNIDTLGEFADAQAEISKKYFDQIIVQNKEIEKSEDKKNKATVKGTKDEDKATEDLNKKKLEGYAKTSGSAEDAMKSVVKSAGMKSVAELIASIFQSMPFPINAILAAGAGATASTLIDKGLASFATGGDFVTSGPQMMMVGDNPSGMERVQITPLGGDPAPNAPAGSNITLNISAPLVDESVVQHIIPAINEAVRRGETLATG